MMTDRSAENPPTGRNVFRRDRPELTARIYDDDPGDPLRRSPNPAPPPKQRAPRKKHRRPMSVLFLQVVSFVVLLAGMLITLLAFGMLGGRGQVGALQSAVFLQMVTMGMALTVGGALGIAVGSACDALAEVREIARRYEEER